MKIRMNWLGMLLLMAWVVPASLFAQEDEWEGKVLRENQTKKVNLYWDYHKTKPQAQGYYYKDDQGETTMKHGRWVYYSQEGQLEEERNYYKDKLHGKVVLVYPNGKMRQEGYFYFGRQDSVYREWNELGNLVVEGNYRTGIPFGKWTYHYRDGRLKSVEETRDSVNYVESFWAQDSAHTQTIVNGTGELFEYYNTGSLKAYYQYKDGLRDGNFEEYSIYGYKLLSGSFALGEKEGEWLYAYYTGDTEKISHYANGKLNGAYTYYYDNGTVNVEGQYTDGMKTGRWTWYTNSGKRDMQGEFKEDKQHGDWTYWYPTGELSYTAHFNMDVKVGQWTYFYKEGKKFKEGTFEADEKNGTWKTWYENGNLLMEGDYLGGKETGQWNNYWENGKLKNEATFTNGQLNGKWVSYYPTGKLKLQGGYKNGMKSGAWTDYFENGRPREMTTYKVIKKKSKVDYGSLKGRVTYESVKHGKFQSWADDDNSLMEEGTYKKGLKQGTWTAYHPGGRLKAVESNYKDDLLDGVVTTFDRRGKKISETEYKNGLKHGTFKLYDKKGKVVAERKYANGMQIIEGQTKSSGGFSPR